MPLSKPQNFTQFVASKTIPPDEIEQTANQIREEGENIVTINGCFDLLHRGHYEMLHEASKLGKVVVLLNSDESIKKLKGEHRPIKPLHDRIAQIAALESVAYVSWFSEDTPIEILKKIKPHVHVNGSDYGEDCIERRPVESFGGRIHVVPLIPGYSTTNLINRICAILVK